MTLLPSKMTRPDFVAAFRDIFEHSAWIAEQAFDAGLDTSADSAAGLHAALVTALRPVDPAAKLALINAHPDLAGKLALAGDLTDDSTAEQASAGLDRLTAEELATFTELNDAYKKRFGFVFIMAVKGKSKDDILAGFRARLPNSPEAEFETALDQIERIAMLRLDAKFA